ncbi:MAG: AAA family ATPase, partial [Gammaproteobacteria bacterium]
MSSDQNDETLKSRAEREAKNRWPNAEPIVLRAITEDEIAIARIAPSCIVEDYLYADVGVFAGPGGTGKTTLALYESIHIALGKSLYGLDIKTPGAVLFITAEDKREQLVARIGKIAERIPLTPAQRAEAFSQLFVLDISAKGRRLCELDSNGNIVLTCFTDQIIDACSKTPCVLIHLDPCTSFGAGERLVNDNEQALIQAARKLSNALGCCVRYIHHVGKANARERTLDQYSARGGSALPDGTRMVTILRSYSPEEDKITPPVGFRIGPADQGLILARPKGSYCPPGQPNIWIKRTGYAFEHQTEIAIPADRELAEFAAQVETYLSDQLRQERYHTKTSLEESNILPQKKLRQVLSELIVSGRVVEVPLPETMRHGRRQTYLRPKNQSVKTNDAPHGLEAKKPSYPQANPSESINPLPYRKKKDDGLVLSSSF